MTEKEPKPHEFKWLEDAEGEFLKFKHESGYLKVRDTNTIMYLFPGQQKYDHLFVVTGEGDDDDTMTGFYLFRGHIDALGEGSFGTLCDQMFEKDFQVGPDEEPSENDIAVYNGYFKPTIDELVKTAMANFDDEATFYLEHEW